jgi:putative heme-binding domain-containing protein
MRLLIAILLLIPAAALADEARPLFDGKTLTGWDVSEGDARWWTVADGAIAGGSLTEEVPRNTFLSTTDRFENFELTLEIRMRNAGGFMNSGIQIRSIRLPKTNMMKGYQVDAGPGWWGKLYDESRRHKVIGEPKDPKAVEAAVRPDGWNEYRIRAEGPEIRSWINGVPALEYREDDATIPLDGHIGLQVHGGGKALIEFRNIRITPLPRRENSPKWPAVSSTDPLPPAEEAKQFRLADGFTAELVLAESEDPANPYGKFVALAFDRQGRLWTTTALEYPVDANESPEASRRLFAAGGRDKVLVVDDPWAEQPSGARVFADGLAIPLGVLPHGDGAFVPYGSEIRRYRDTDGDGRADTHETVLDGFGLQDSHLFPHQFTRVPGGWILLAQGLFNTSVVRRPGGLPFADGTREVRFDACKLARFRFDGSTFEPLTAGPNNLWGLTISRTGEMWAQEANDLGYPIFPCEPGVHVTTFSRDLLRPYQPLMPPPLAPAQMGGTGLSGLALADDLDGWPAPWGAGAGANADERIFYVANPISCSIQSIIATRSGVHDSYRRGPDLLTSGDKAFRPVAIQFGPDGCLYVVDWYNKIISHNEVPRDHPDRDRVRGRIWRIRHTSQPRREPVTIAKVATADLPAHLGSPNARIADLAWQEIVDRDARSLVPELVRIVSGTSAAAGARAGGLWALEGLGAVKPPLLERLVTDANADLRREAVRIAAATCSEHEFLRLAAPLVDDPSPRVRAAVGDALRRIPITSADTIALAVRLGRGRAEGDEWTVYDRDFERFLARWALEKHPAQVAAFLASPAGRELPVENRLLATLALEPSSAARELAASLPGLSRPPDVEEVRAVALRAEMPEVAAAIGRLLAEPSKRIATLRGLLAVAPTPAATAVAPLVSPAVKTLLAGDAPEADRLLGLDLAAAFKLRDREPDVAAICRNKTAAREERKRGLRALRAMGDMSADTARGIVEAADGDAALRTDAIAAWADSRDPAAAVALVAAWGELSFDERQAAAVLLARHREGARALVAALDADDIEPQSLPLSTLGDMRAVLGADPTLERVQHAVAVRAPAVLRLGGGEDAAGPAVSLEGPFTVEAWVNLEQPIGREDSLLAGDGQIDLGFPAGRLRVWTKAQGDLAVAKTASTPDSWTHYAVTRDAEGVFRIYVDGEFEAESTKRETLPYPGLRVGFSTALGGTRGRIAEFRVWNRARTAAEIRADFDRSYEGDDRLPSDLVAFHGGRSWGDFVGNARIEPAIDPPTLVTAAALAAREEKFARFRALAEADGDAARGKAIFTTRCLGCHQQGGQGAAVGPALDGLGLTGTEAILRNVLTPSAAMEGGYRTFRVVTRDGRIVQGLLVSRDPHAIVIRQPAAADIRLSPRDVDQAGFIGVSVMPEGLLESMPPQEVSDLFAHLRSLTGAAPRP